MHNNEPWTIQKAAQSALDAQSACNATAVAKALHEIGRAHLHAGYGTNGAQRSAPFKLMMFQMCSLAGITVDYNDDNRYYDIYKECQELTKGE